MGKKRLLIIGTAPQVAINEYLGGLDFDNTEIHLLVPERDRDVYDLSRITYFQGIFHPFFPPLVRAMLLFRPTDVVVLCGMTYDHDNAVKAVLFYSCFKNLNVDISVRNENTPANTKLCPSPLKEFLKWIGLGLIALTIKAISPFKKIRVAEVYSSRLGHLALDCEIYLSEAELGRHDNYIDLFTFKEGKIANATLANMFAREMDIHKKFSYIFDAVHRFNMNTEHELRLVTRKLAHGRDAECVIHQT